MKAALSPERIKLSRAGTAPPTNSTSLWTRVG